PPTPPCAPRRGASPRARSAHTSGGSVSGAALRPPGLYFIGEVMDVTGWLGGYNFQWAWSSAWACAQALVEG
ncbi:NAD(P)/FAD-dependent oxidoreductase, partial [Klebsiella pneumoniae]|uniref:NAD(P)/FAD-dependent oxidoreductase n=1 Tax=Klebsiella pneumoniae TaxID=573 RepID=UPI0030F2A09D